MILKVIKFDFVMLDYEISEEDNIKKFLNRISSNDDETLKIKKLMLSYYSKLENQIIKKENIINLFLKYIRATDIFEEDKNIFMKNDVFNNLEKYKKEKFNLIIGCTMIA